MHVHVCSFSDDVRWRRKYLRTLSNMQRTSHGWSNNIAVWSQLLWRMHSEMLGGLWHDRDHRCPKCRARACYDQQAEMVSLLLCQNRHRLWLTTTGIFNKCMSIHLRVNIFLWSMLSNLHIVVVIGTSIVVVIDGGGSGGCDGGCGRRWSGGGLVVMGVRVAYRNAIPGRPWATHHCHHWERECDIFVWLWVECVSSLGVWVRYFCVTVSGMCCKQKSTRARTSWRPWSIFCTFDRGRSFAHQLGMARRKRRNNVGSTWPRRLWSPPATVHLTASPILLTCGIC